MALKEFTHAQTSALVGEADALLPHAKWPDDGTGRDPRRQVYTWYQSMMDAATGRPAVDDANFAPVILVDDDFLSWEDGNFWSYNSATGGGTGPAVQSDSQGGVLLIYPGSVSCSDCVLVSTNRLVRIDAETEVYFETRVMPHPRAAAFTGDIFMFGLVSQAAGGSMAATGSDHYTSNGGVNPANDEDMIVFYKGNTCSNWDFSIQDAAIADPTSDIAVFASDTWIRFGFHVKPGYDAAGAVSTTKSQITPYVNGVAGTAGEVTVANIAQGMFLIYLLKSQAGAGSPNLRIDYVKLAVERAV